MNLKNLYHPPAPGILAYLLVFVVQALGHSLMVLMEQVFGSAYVYQSATALGIAGAVMVWLGRNREELPATLLGFAGGSLVWDGWVEFAFHFYARHLNVAPLIENGEIVTKQEYLVLPSSIGVLFATLLFFYFNKDTRCNFFLWFQRNLRMNPGEPASARGRNIASIVAMETIYITWFFYIMLLVLYDKSIAGDRHPATYAALFGTLVWSVFLLTRLVRFARMAPALRYAIPTAIVSWNVVEILGRWNMFTEIWINPRKYALEMGLVVLGFVVAALLAVLAPARQPTRVA